MSFIVLTAVWLQLSCDLPIHIYCKLPVSYCVKHRLLSYMYFFSRSVSSFPECLLLFFFVLSAFTTPTSFLEILWCLEDLRLQLYFGTEKPCFFSLPFPFCLRMSPGIQMQYQQDGIFTASFSSETLPNSFSLYHNQTALVSNYYNQFQQIISMHWKPQSLSLVRPRFIPVYRDLYSWYTSACLDLLSVWDCSHVITMPSFPGML